jgi:hypothetical protein
MEISHSTDLETPARAVERFAAGDEVTLLYRGLWTASSKKKQLIPKSSRRCKGSCCPLDQLLRHERWKCLTLIVVS